MREKPSVYLSEKCRVLKEALDYFLDEKGSYCKTRAERMAVFLSQIDFWEWELDSLVFAFDNFRERSKAWGSSATLAGLLAKHGIVVKNAVLEDLDYKRSRRAHARPALRDGEIISAEASAPVVAPTEALNVVIRRWNKLLAQCERTVMTTAASLEQSASLGAQVLVNLDKFRKEALLG